MSPGTRRYARALSWVATITSGIVLVVSGGAYGYVSYLNSKITKFGDLCIRSCNGGGPTEVAGENFLLVGVDSRAGDNGTGALAGLKDATTGGSRSDTTLLVHIAGGGGRVDVVSFPRDMLVTVPSYTTPNGKVIAAHQAKFNAAYAEGADNDPKKGGPQLLTEQIKEDFGLKVDHYVQVDFAGFENIVKALGTVQVCLSQDAYDPTYTGFKLSKGIHNLGPTLALEFVRQRHGLGSDLDRINRQQRFLAAIMRKTLSAGTLTNPSKLNSVLSAALSSLTTDNGTNLDDLETLGRNLKGLSSGGVHFFTIPTSGNEDYGDLGNVLLIDSAKTKTLLQDIHDDVDPTKVATPKASPAAKPTPVVPADPSSVTVTSIENASGVGGAASKARTALTNAGVTVTTIGDAAHTGGGTNVRYGTGAAAQAAAVAGLLPNAHTTADSTLAAGTVVVTIGSTAVASSPTAASPTSAKPTTATNFEANGTLCGP